MMIDQTQRLIIIFLLASILGAIISLNSNVAFLSGDLFMVNEHLRHMDKS